MNSGINSNELSLLRDSVESVLQDTELSEHFEKIQRKKLQQERYLYFDFTETKPSAHIASANKTYKIKKVENSSEVVFESEDVSIPASLENCEIAFLSHFSDYPQTLQSFVKLEDDAMGFVASLSGALHIRINGKLDQPLKILWKEAPFPLLFIDVSEKGQADLVLDIDLAGNVPALPIFYLSQGAESQVTISERIRSTVQSTVVFRRSFLERKAQQVYEILPRYVKHVRYDIAAHLNGENSEVNIRALAPLSGEENLDTGVDVFHRASYTKSVQMFYAVLDEKATESFTGRIYVEEGIGEVKADQLHRGILLSDEAASSTRPQLEIYADAVECSHGSSTGTLDETAVIYLQSRGFSEEEARLMLVHGFAARWIEESTGLTQKFILADFLKEREKFFPPSTYNIFPEENNG